MEKSLLTSREREIFDLLIQDKNAKEIGEILLISESTVRTHISNVMKKLRVKVKSKAVFELIRLGEIQFSITKR